MKLEYEVKLDLFEGPLDLLLYLVTKTEVSIVDISVSAITEQYLQYLDVMRELNIDVASEYLHMAATLVRLKARELLPRQDNEVLPQEEGIYNREQLIQQLLEYKKYKEAAHSLRTFESQQAGSYSRGTAETVSVTETADNEVYIGNISMFDLMTAFRKILERSATQTEDTRHMVATDHVRIDDRIEHILTLICDKGEVPFEELFAGDMRRIVVVVTIMALLELVKMQEINFRQENLFTRIFVVRRDPATREALTDEPATDDGSGDAGDEPNLTSDKD